MSSVSGEVVSGVARFGLISLRSLGLIITAFVGVAWLPGTGVASDSAHPAVTNGRARGREPVTRGISQQREDSDDRFREKDI